MGTYTSNFDTNYDGWEEVEPRNWERTTTNPQSGTHCLECSPSGIVSRPVAMEAAGVLTWWQRQSYIGGGGFIRVLFDGVVEDTFSYDGTTGWEEYSLAVPDTVTEISFEADDQGDGLTFAIDSIELTNVGLSPPTETKNGYFKTSKLFSTNMPNYPIDSTIAFEFTTHDNNNELVAPSEAFVAADFQLVKLSTGAVRNSMAGVAVTSPVRTIEGLHRIVIDTSDDTDEGFYEAGELYKLEYASAKTVAGTSQLGITVLEFGIEFEELTVTVTGSSGATVQNPVGVNINFSIPGNDVIVAASTRSIFVKETGIIVLLTANVDVSEIPLVVIIENPDRTDKLIVLNEDLTKNGTDVSFTLPDTFTDEIGSYVLGVRHATTKRFYGRSQLSVIYAPFEDV